MTSHPRVGALVEVSATADGSISESLLALAYGASEGSFVVLAHRGVTARAVDRVLDRIVPRFGLRANGVIYADANDTSATVDIARRARVVVAQTPELQAALADAGIAYVSAGDAAEALATLRQANPPRRATPTPTDPSARARVAS